MPSKQPRKIAAAHPSTSFTVLNCASLSVIMNSSAAFIIVSLSSSSSLSISLSVLSPDGFESVGVEAPSVLGKMRGPRKLSSAPKCGWKSTGLRDRKSVV